MVVGPREIKNCATIIAVDWRKNLDDCIALAANKAALNNNPIAIDVWVGCEE
jgi:hypothetical protein